MIIDDNIKSAEFTINKKVLIRFKKDFGFWIHKEMENNNWYTCLKSFKINPFAIGFKIQYGFDYKDLKTYFYESFEDALSMIDEVDKLPYWEYNMDTHIRVYDTIMKKDRANEVLEEIISNLVNKKLDKLPN